MNLFRSEEHVRNWADFDPESVDGVRPVAALARLFSSALHWERLAPDYLLRIDEHSAAFPALQAELGGGSAFWQLAPPAR